MSRYLIGSCHFETFNTIDSTILPDMRVLGFAPSLDVAMEKVHRIWTDADSEDVHERMDDIHIIEEYESDVAVRRWWYEPNLEEWLVAEL